MPFIRPSCDGLAARELIRERGLRGTRFADVLVRTGAPRGSVYLHFPGGKTELAVGAAAAHRRDQLMVIDTAAAESTSAGAFLRRYVDFV